MKKYLAWFPLFAAVLGFAGPASAAVVTGSTYSVYIEGLTSGQPFLAVTQFDDLAASGDRFGQTITLSESETALSATSSRISVNLASDSDLFPAVDDVAILAINDGFDFVADVILDEVRITFRNAAGGVVYASDNLVGLATQNSPWDGTLPSPDRAFGIDEIGAMNVVNISFDFIVSTIPGEVAVPEPGSLMLFSLGLLAFAGLCRQRRTGH